MINTSQNFSLSYTLRSLNIVIATGHGLDDRRIGVSFPVETGYSSEELHLPGYDAVWLL
jgi:hypothetical protein